MTRPGSPAEPGLRRVRGRTPTWAPAVLLAHLAVLALVLAVWQVTLRWRTAVPSQAHPAPLPVQLAGWVLALGTFAVVLRGVGARRTSRTVRWATATAAMPVTVLTWTVVPVAAATPQVVEQAFGAAVLFGALPALLALLVGAPVMAIVVQPRD